MSLPPRVRSVLTPTPLAASLCLAINGSPNAVVATASQNLTPTTMPKRTVVNTVQKHVSLHCVRPLVVYLLEDVTSQSAQAHVSRRLVVQNTVTREIVDSLSLADLSYLIYRETDINKIPQAVQSLGIIQSLDFYDPSTLHWSGMAVTCSAAEEYCGDGKSPGRWATVVIQTSTRILFWNIRQGPNSHSVLYPSRKASIFKRLGAIIHETALGGNGAVPSSNLLPLSATSVLIGCSDGSLKSYDWHQKAVLKSIKGLGKGDWIVQLLPANRYTVNEGDSNKRRILTVTKKGICYLIELEINGDALEIKPPLARFGGGLAEPPADSSMQHTTITYDAHRDLIFWLALNPKAKQISMLVWNLQMLQADLVQQVGSKNLFKPDPTLTIHLPAFCVEYSQGNTLTTVYPVLHGAFSEDTVLLASVSCTTGDLHLIGASFHPTNATSVVTGTPVLSTDVADLIQEDGSLDFTPIVKSSSVMQSPLLAGSSNSLLVVTNLGLVFLELPVMSKKLPAAHHVHFGAGLGSLGKSILYVKGSSVMYGSLDVLVANPTGRMVAKNPIQVHDSPLPLHLPPEIQKRPFRSAPQFIPSPSGLYICLFWSMEFCYEILHTATLLQKVGQRSGQSKSLRKAVVSTGNGIIDFCWVGDEDIYAVLRAPDAVEEATAFMVTPAALEQTEGEDSGGGKLSSVKSVATLAQSMTKQGLTGTLMVAKSATSAATAATSATLAATKSATKAAMTSSKKGMKKTLGLFGKKKRRGEEGGLSTESEIGTDDLSEVTEDPIALATPLPAVDLNLLNQGAQTVDNSKRRRVELRKLELLDSKAVEMNPTVAAANSSPMGVVLLRGGNRFVPTTIFGGPVLCVGSRTEEDPEGSANFYAKKKDAGSSNSAQDYVSTGPTLPYPDLVVWDDDGILCAVAVENRVAVYGLEGSDFILLGTVRITSPTDPFARISSAKFVAGSTLFCCTSSTVHVVFMGDLDGIPQMETHLIAATDAPAAGPIAALQQYRSFMPPSIPLPLVRPSVLGLQSGSLVISSEQGLHALSLAHPLLRIGCLLGAGQAEAAAKWFDAVPSYECEALSGFVERRGFPEVAINIPGISLERLVDMSMRYGFITQLEEIVEIYGVRGIRAIDAGRGLSPDLFGEPGGSVVVCVATYLLAHGRVELARRMATECLRSGDEGRRDALMIASLLLSVDEVDALRLVGRAVEDAGDWPIAQFIQHHTFAERT